MMTRIISRLGEVPAWPVPFSEARAPWVERVLRQTGKPVRQRSDNMADDDAARHLQR